MGSMDGTDISILRATSKSGEQVVLCCTPSDSVSIVFSGDEGEWFSKVEDIDSVIVDCSGPVQLTSPKDIFAMSAWLSAAGVWLQQKRLEREDI